MLLASCATDVKFHSSQNGKLLHTYKSRDDQTIKNISWCKDGCWLALVPNNGVAELISIRDNDTTLLQTLTAIQNVNVSAFQKTTKKHIAMGTQNGIVAVYDLKAKSIVKQFKRAKSAIQCIDCNMMDTHIAAACDEGDILLLSTTTNQISNTFSFPNKHIGSILRFHRNKRNLLVSGSLEGSVAVWDINSGNIKWHTQVHAGPVTDVTFSPLKDNLLVTIGSDRKCSFYDINTKKAVLEMHLEKAATCVDIHKDATCIAMGSSTGNVALYDLRNMQEPLHTISAHKSKVKSVRFQPDITQERSQPKNFVDISEESMPRMISNVSGNTFGNVHFSGFSPANRSSRHESDLHLDGNANTNNGDDSFMDVIGGLGFSNASRQEICDTLPDHRGDSVQNGHSHEFVDDCLRKNEDFQEYLPSKSRVKVDQIKTSTPKLLDANNTKFDANVDQPSPILSGTNNNLVQHNIKPEELKSILKEVADEMKGEIREELMSGLAQIRHQFMNLHMSLLREFVLMDNNINGLRDDLAGNQETDQDILDENSILKQQVESLQRQIREMQMNNRH